MKAVWVSAMEQIRILVNGYDSSHTRPVDSLPLPNVLRRIRDQAAAALPGEHPPESAVEISRIKEELAEATARYTRAEAEAMHLRDMERYRQRTLKREREEADE